ncbi:MAG: GntR family transcriptional regulator, partial [Ktedonobacterales bacterium]
PMPVPETAPVSRLCLRDAAYYRLRDWILDGTLAPDEPLRDEALAEALGMSRTPVREALQRLEDDGLVVTTATRRSFVSPVTLAQAREIFPIVESLEALAVRLASSRMDDAALAAMRAANARLAAALAAEDATAALEADTALHAAFLERTGNGELIALLADLKSKVRRIERTFWGGADRRDSLRDHDELIAAFAAHDGDAARAIIQRNWRRGLGWINPERADSGK